MGHTVDTYHDIQMKGIEFLRNIYATSGISIKPKTKATRIDALKEIVRAWGLNPEQILTKEALSQEATLHISPEDQENRELQLLSKTLRDLIRQDALNTK